MTNELRENILEALPAYPTLTGTDEERNKLIEEGYNQAVDNIIKVLDALITA